MTDILTIGDLIQSNADNLSTFLIIVAIVASIVIGIAEYKSRLFEYITNIRNRFWFIYGLVMFAAIIFCHQKCWINGYWFIGSVVFWVLYAIAIILSLKPKRFMGCSDPVLKRYEKWLIDGRSNDHIDFFRKSPPWYLFTAEDKLEYYMLACLFFEDLNEFDNAYKSLGKIKDSWLYENEKDIINLKRALLLVQMGNMKAAHQILGDSEKNKSNDPMVWFTYSFIYENAGDIDKALFYAEKSRDIVDAGYQASDYIIAQVYNNYSRVAVLKGNRQEALRYLYIAWKKVKDSTHMKTVHIVASNRIAQMALNGKSREECEAALKEYKDLITKDSFINKVKYINCEISYYRQIKDAKKELERIKSGLVEMVEKLNSVQRVLYITSTFLMLMNGHFDHKWFDNNVKEEVKEYEDLPLMDRLVVYYEFMGIFQQEKFRSVLNKRPYMVLKENIMKYYREQAIEDIDGLLAEVEPFDRFKYMNLMKMKLGILKLIEGKSHIDKSERIYVDLYKELYDAGLHLDSVRVLMTLIDECSSAYNILIWRPFWQKGLYYSDILESETPPPEPMLDPDGIHVNYFQVQLTQPFIIQPLHENVIREYIDTIIDEFKRWKNHPFKIELSIEIAHILMCLDRRNEAREFFQFYKDSGVSENQMTSWAREEIAALEIVFKQ